MKPGRSVASPRSTTVAPAGTGIPRPIALIFEPSTTITPSGVAASPRPSKSRFARRTVTESGGASAAATGPASRTRATATRATEERAMGSSSRSGAGCYAGLADPHDPGAAVRKTRAVRGGAEAAGRLERRLVRQDDRAPVHRDERRRADVVAERDRLLGVAVDGPHDRR